MALHINAVPSNNVKQLAEADLINFNTITYLAIAAALAFITAPVSRAEHPVIYNEIINKATPIVSLSPSSASVTSGTSIAFTTVVAGVGVKTPTGSVLFTAKPVSGDPTNTGNTTGTQSAITAISSLDKTGTATWNNTLPTGTYSVTALYNGDGSYENARSSTQVASVASIQISPAETTSTVTQGSSWSTNIQVTSTQSLQGVIMFSCSGLAPGMSCSFAPPSVPAGSSQKTLLTLITTSPTAPATQGAAVLLMLGIAFARRRKLVFKVLLCLFVATLGVVGTTGCSAVHTMAEPTPAGTYNVIVTATTGSMSQSKTITVTVK
jgi:MYXO-CTERM domain-containing protein